MDTHFTKLQMLYRLYDAIYMIGHIPHDHGVTQTLHKELDSIRTETIRALIIEEINELLALIARQGTT